MPDADKLAGPAAPPVAATSSAIAAPSEGTGRATGAAGGTTASPGGVAPGGGAREAAFIGAASTGGAGAIAGRLAPGTVALVTGAARRVGRAIAEELARAGARVVVHHHGTHPDEARAVAAGLAGDAFALRADLRDPTACARLLDEVRDRAGGVDLVVNSAAAYPRGAFAESSDAVYRDVLELNLVAPARLVRLALPLGLSSVINVVDVAAWQPWKNHAAYAASKAGLTQLTRCLALELAPAVRVNAVAPGTVAWPESLGEPERAAILARIPLARVGTPEDVARAVRYLASEPYLTGVVLPADGGAGLR